MLVVWLLVIDSKEERHVRRVRDGRLGDKVAKMTSADQFQVRYL